MLGGRYMEEEILEGGTYQDGAAMEEGNMRLLSIYNSSSATNRGRKI